MQNFLKGIGIIFSSTIALVYLCTFLGSPAFHATSLAGVIFIAFTLTVVATIVFYVISLAIWIPLKVENPGLVIPTGLGVIAGTIAIWLTGQFLPNSVLISSIWSGLPFALLNTALICAVSVLLRTGSRQRPLWPQW